jgi:glutamate/tyrosine decarboxylase-like PLP-dependent enzyme
LDGIELATTVTMDPHKILGVNQALGFLAVRDTELLGCLGKVGIGYYVPGDEPDLGRWSMDNSRCLESLAGWLMLRALGKLGYAQIVDHMMALTAAFCAELTADGGFELFRPPVTNVIAFRSRAWPGEPVQAQNSRNEAILRKILNEEKFSLSWYGTADGRRFLRAVFVNPASTLDDIRAFAAALSAAALGSVQL